MNRAQRRASKKKAVGARIIPLPAMLDEFIVFGPPQELMDAIHDGQLNTIDDKPVFRGADGQWTEICPALAGWIYTWKQLDPSNPLTNLTQLNHDLYSGRIITQETYRNARDELKKCREYWRTADREKMRETARVCQIRLLLDRDDNLTQELS